MAGIDKITAVRDLSAGNFLDYIGAPDTTVSATFVAITGASTTINQSSLGGWYLINISVSCYSTIANTEVEFSIKVDGTSVYLFRFFFNAASQHTCISANYVLLATTTTGAHTFAVEWRRMSGTGTLHIDTNDWIKMSVLHAGGN